MKAKEVNAVEVWKQVEDVLTPQLGLTPIERAVYLHFVRHSRVEGKRRLRFSVYAVSRQLNLSHGPVRRAVRRFAELRVLRLIERTKSGHVVEVRLPEEIEAVRTGKVGRIPARRVGQGPSLESVDFLRTRELQWAIHAREGGVCFYCLRRIPARARCLDHVVPRARWGRNSYRNLVSCCMECNSAKSERGAAEFLRSLYREGRLIADEFKGRLRALNAVESGKAKPVVRARVVVRGI